MAHRSSTRGFSFYLIEGNDEFQQNLTPIVGYACQPIVTLEEACKPLEWILPKLHHYISIAKKKSNHPMNNLTVDEAATIRLYTMQWDLDKNGQNMSLYSQLNRTLRDTDRNKLKPWFLYLKLFMMALTKLPMTSVKTVWRGIRDQDSTMYIEGNETIWWAFSSCSQNMNVLNADQFLGKIGKRALFSIETFDGRSIKEYSDFPEEEEVLLLPGTCLRVHGKLNPAPDLHVIQLKQVQPKQTLIERPFNATDTLTHTIKAGDTFWTLSIKYNCSIDAIQAMNPGVDSTKLEIGEIIRLPNVVITYESNKSSKNDSDVITHTVFAGDTLERIAQWFHCTIDDLIQLNPGIQPDLLYPGQHILLPSNERTRCHREKFD